MLFAFLLIPLSLAAVPEPFSTTSQAPAQSVISLLDVVVSIVAPLMFTMIVIAAFVYAIGQLFGAETRARATVWSQRMLVAVGMAALIILVMIFLVPNIMQGGSPGAGTNTENYIAQLKSLIEVSLIGLTMTLIILAAFVFLLGQLGGAETRAKASSWVSGLIGAAILAGCIYLILYQLMPTLENLLTDSLYVYARVIIEITFFVSFFILITYLFSNVFKIPEWEAYLNIEMSNLYMSFLVVVFVFALFAVGSVVASAWSADKTPAQAAISYMRGTVADSVLKGMYDVYQIQVCTSMMGTFSKRIGEAVLTQVFRVFPGIDTFVSITNVIAMGLVSVYGSLQAQIALLYLVDGTMLPLFLPAGLVLRFFPPTREAGAFLISLAFGFQIIYPMTYLINAQIYSEIGAKPYASPTVLIYSLCGPVKYGFWGYMLTQTNPPMAALSKMVGGQSFGLFLSSLVSESTLNFISMAEFIPIMQSLAGLSLLAIFMPALSMMVTIAFINAMTKFLVSKV